MVLLARHAYRALTNYQTIFKVQAATLVNVIEGTTCPDAALPLAELASNAEQVPIRLLVHLLGRRVLAVQLVPAKMVM